MVMKEIIKLKTDYKKRGTPVPLLILIVNYFLTTDLFDLLRE